MAAFLVFAGLSVALAAVDVREHRLPNPLVACGALSAVSLLAAASLVVGEWAAFGRAIVASLALFAFYFAMRVLRPGAMGGGDVKLAGVIGLHLGWIGWTTVVVGATLAFVLGGIYAVVLMMSRRADRRTAIAFGPWMLAGAWTAIFAGVLANLAQ